MMAVETYRVDGFKVYFGSSIYKLPNGSDAENEGKEESRMIEVSVFWVKQLSI